MELKKLKQEYIREMKEYENISKELTENDYSKIS